MARCGRMPAWSARGEYGHIRLGESREAFGRVFCRRGARRAAPFYAPPLYSRGPLTECACGSARVASLHMNPAICTILCSFQIPQRLPAPFAPTLCPHPCPYVYLSRTVILRLLRLLGLLSFLRPVLVVPLPLTPQPLRHGPVGKRPELARTRPFPRTGKHRGAPQSRAFIVRVRQHDLRHERHGPLWQPGPDQGRQPSKGEHPSLRAESTGVACWLVASVAPQCLPPPRRAVQPSRRHRHRPFRVSFADHTSRSPAAELGVAHYETAAGLDRAARRAGHADHVPVHARTDVRAVLAIARVPTVSGARRRGPRPAPHPEAVETGQQQQADADRCRGSVHRQSVHHDCM
ncbi:hypothetical protein LXA43DRAFT_1150725, partial [Ganoderma leucocontextum]